MVRGYQTQDIKQKVVEVLSNSRTGLSGVEISEKLGVNRVTMAKYLNVFAAEGLIQQKNIGNVILWFIEEGSEQFHFPDDYFKVKNYYLELLLNGSEHQIQNLIRNCKFSNADIIKILIEVILPAIDSIQEMSKKGKIGKSEQKFLEEIISNSIKLLHLLPSEINPEKKVIVISADSKSTILAQAASAAFHSSGWHVMSFGDMSDSIDVLFDLDLQKFLTKHWKPKKEVLVFLVFSETTEGLKFFSESVNSVKGKFGKNLSLVLCGKNSEKNLKADLVTGNLEDAIQWSQTTFERFQS